MQFQLDIATDELEHAQWFSKSEVADAVRRIEADPMLKWLQRGDVSGSFLTESLKQQLRYVPPKGAIAYQLIKQWVEGVV